MNPQSFAQFTSLIAGEMIVPGSQAYDHVRTVFNQNQNIKPAANTQA